MAQVFDALSYYSDHQDAINAHVERNQMTDKLIDPLVKNLLRTIYLFVCI